MQTPNPKLTTVDILSKKDLPSQDETDDVDYSDSSSSSSSTGDEEEEQTELEPAITAESDMIEEEHPHNTSEEVSSSTTESSKRDALFSAKNKDRTMFFLLNIKIMSFFIQALISLGVVVYCLVWMAVSDFDEAVVTYLMPPLTFVMGIWLPNPSELLAKKQEEESHRRKKKRKKLKRREARLSRRDR